MRRASWLLAATVGLCLCGETVAWARDSDCPEDTKLESSIDTAEGFYVRRQYPQVAELLEPIAAQDGCLRDERQRIDVHLLLGITYHETNELGLAELEFLALLRMQPDYALDGIIPVPAAAVAYLEETRLRHEEELNEIRITKGGGKDVVVETLFVTFEDQRNQFWINFVPFGAGQFQNDQLEWGAAFATAELVALGGNALGAIMVEVLRQRTDDPAGRFTASERAQAESWDTVKLIGGWSFVALYALGTVHGILSYEETRRLRMLPPSKEMPDSTAERSSSPSWSWMIAPVAADEAMGIGLLVGF